MFIAVFSMLPLPTATVVDEVKNAFRKADDLHAMKVSINSAVVKLVPVIKKEHQR